MRRRTRDHGHRLAHLLVEKAVPGTVAGDERPEPATASPWVEEKKAQGVVAPNSDRLACARELVVQEATLAQCWKHGGRAFMGGRGEILPDDSEDPMRTAMRQMMEVFAPLNREQRRRAGGQGGVVVLGRALDTGGGMVLVQQWLVPVDDERIRGHVEVRILGGSELRGQPVQFRTQALGRPVQLLARALDLCLLDTPVIKPRLQRLVPRCVPSSVHKAVEVETPAVRVLQWAGGMRGAVRLGRRRLGIPVTWPRRRHPERGAQAVVCAGAGEHRVSMVVARMAAPAGECRPTRHPDPVPSSPRPAQGSDEVM